jgi:hypothetical protein
MDMPSLAASGYLANEAPALAQAIRRRGLLYWRRATSCPQMRWSATSVCGSTGRTPATHDRCAGADHSPQTIGRRAPRGYGSILSKP